MFSLFIIVHPWTIDVLLSLVLFYGFYARLGQGKVIFVSPNKTWLNVNQYIILIIFLVTPNNIYIYI